jgi:multidrug efflux pump subunit AcrA (membrane-fusion protein)
VTTRGKVTEVGAASNPATRTFHVKISLKHERVISGMYAAVRVPAGVVEAVFAPDGAIVSRGQIKGVYVVGADDVAVFRAVSTGKKAEGGFTEVLSGLSGGEDLIAGGVERAVDGGVLKGRGL